MTYRIGIVGAGTATRNLHLPVLKNTANVEIAWLADANEETAISRSRAYRVPHVALPKSLSDLPHCDIVLLAIPVGYRTPYYEFFAGRGTAVFAEKPFTLSLSEHKRILGLFPDHRIACGYQRRTYANNQLLRKIVVERWFGPLQEILIAEGARTTRTDTNVSHYDDIQAAGGGIIMTIGCHTLDLAFYFTGATSFRIGSKNLEMDARVDRKVEASIDLLNVHGREGEHCRLDYCVSWLDRQENTIRLVFPEVTVVTGTKPESSVFIKPHASTLDTSNEVRARGGARTGNQAFFLEWESFLRGIKEERPSIVSAGNALSTTALIEALYEGEATV